MQSDDRGRARNRQNKNTSRIRPTQQSVQRRTIPKTPEAYHLGSCHRTTTWRSIHNARATPTSKSKGNSGGPQLCSGTLKKKDGKLRPVQDYRPINKWTRRNQNISPLIPQVIDRLRGCTLFTKVDVRW